MKSARRESLGLLFSWKKLALTEARLLAWGGSLRVSEFTVICHASWNRTYWGFRYAPESESVSAVECCSALCRLSFKLLNPRLSESVLQHHKARGSRSSRTTLPCSIERWSFLPTQKRTPYNMQVTMDWYRSSKAPAIPARKKPFWAMKGIVELSFKDIREVDKVWNINNCRRI